MKKVGLIFVGLALVISFSSSTLAATTNTSMQEEVTETITSTTKETSPSLHNEPIATTDRKDEAQLQKKNTAPAFYTTASEKKYFTITTPNDNFWTDFTATPAGITKNYFQQTFQILSKITTFDDKVYYKLQGQTIFYVLATSGVLSDSPLGLPQPKIQYLTFKNATTYWGDNTLQNGQSTNPLTLKTWQSRNTYLHADGEKYFDLYSNKGNFVGFIKASSTNITSIAGTAIKQQKYVTLTATNYPFLQSWIQSTTQTTKKYYQQSFLVKELYHHFDGNDYYSLYQLKGGKQVRVGFTNVKATTTAPGGQGVYQKLGKYVTITNKNYQIHQNFNWKYRNKTRNLYGKTFLARGLYRHVNGATYYTLYNQKGNWIGYLNSAATKVATGPQGIYQKWGKSVVLTNKNQPLWQNFKWQKKNTSQKLMGSLYVAKGYYEHANGARYLSLYTQSGKWQGYINAGATKQATSKAQKLKQVQQLLNRKYKNKNLGIYVMSLTDGSVAQINGNKNFHAASTGKLPALYYTQKQINAKKLNPYKKYRYTDAINKMSLSYMRGGAGILQSKRFGNYYSLDTIMNWTCKYSDNQGANFLGYYGADKYSQKMKNEISSIIGRKWTRFSVINAKENTRLLKAMYFEGGKVLTYLSHTTYDSQRLPKYLPVRVAHKIGDLGGYAHDCGIVYTKEPYVISVMTQGTGYEIISRISKDVYQIMK